MEQLNKSLPINLFELNKIKQNSLFECYRTYYEMVSEILGILKKNKGITRSKLHKRTYYSFREKYGAPSQLVISARVTAWNKRKQRSPNKVCLKFDKKLFSLKKTKIGNPVLSVRVNSERIGLPVKKDGALKRIRKHLKKGWEITSVIMKPNLNFRAILSKKFEPKFLPNLMGIDINSSRIAITILNPRTGKTLKQTYFGKDIYPKQTRFEQRRARLMQYRDKDSDRAGKKLKQLGGKQKNFVKTRIWQIVAKLLRLAKTYHATPVMEDIKNLKKSANQMRKKSRKKINIIPYRFFRSALENKFTEAEIRVIKVNPRYTSQRCPNCGHTSKGNWVSGNYVLFRCQKCGLEANRDRMASKNAALKAILSWSDCLPALKRQSVFQEWSCSQPTLLTG